MVQYLKNSCAPHLSFQWLWLPCCRARRSHDFSDLQVQTLIGLFFSWNSSTLDQLLVTWWKTISQKLFGFSDKFGFLSSVSLYLFIDLIWDGKEVFIFFTCSFKMLNFPVLYFFFFTNSGILLFWSVSHKLTVWSLGSCLDLTFPGHVLYDWLSLTYCCLSFSLLSPFFFCISFFFFNLS